jgi:hypothetical protein
LRTFLEKCLELKTSKEVPISPDALDDYTNSIVSKIYNVIASSAYRLFFVDGPYRLKP